MSDFDKYVYPGTDVLINKFNCSALAAASPFGANKMKMENGTVIGVSRSFMKMIRIRRSIYILNREPYHHCIIIPQPWEFS